MSTARGLTTEASSCDWHYFQPATGMNPETLALYEKNILTITRQVRFSEKAPTLSIDVVLGLNGLPVATAELKNPFTGQNVSSRQETIPGGPRSDGSPCSSSKNERWSISPSIPTKST